MQHLYAIGGLRVASDVALPHARPVAPGADAEASAPGDDLVEIRRVETLDRPAGALHDGVRFAADPRDVWFSVDEGLALRVRQGRRIDVFCPDEGRQEDVVLYLMGSAWGVLCHQRRRLPLHCSAVADGEHAIALCAESGEGKSTLAAALAAAGFAHVCDDVALLDPEGDSLRFTPVDKGLKLHREVAERLALTGTGRVSALPDFDKIYARPASSGARDHYRLRAVVSLRRSRADALVLRPLSGAEAFSTLDDNV
ncbi:MAG: hypothetical protein AAF676_06425, partial [Pseudomonadota bacterium]